MPIAISTPLQMRNPMMVRSSSLAQVAYDSCRAELQVEFRDGTAYLYGGVPLWAYQEFLRADSKGAYFNHYIRNRFPTQCLQPRHRPGPFERGTTPHLSTRKNVRMSATDY
jgi:hypothetical protein